MKNFKFIGIALIVTLVSMIGGHQLQKYLYPVNNEKNTAAQSSRIKQIEPGMLPVFSLTDKDGVLRNSSEWDGKILVLNFWATWCPPCKKEIPEFIRLQSEFTDHGVQFIGIALQKAEEVQDFVREIGINYPILTGELDVIDLATKLGNRTGALPYTVVVDKNRKITLVHRGAITYQQAQDAIRSVL